MLIDDDCFYYFLIYLNWMHDIALWIAWVTLHTATFHFYSKVGSSNHKYERYQMYLSLCMTHKSNYTHFKYCLSISSSCCFILYSDLFYFCLTASYSFFKFVLLYLMVAGSEADRKHVTNVWNQTKPDHEAMLQGNTITKRLNIDLYVCISIWIKEVIHPSG